MSLFSRVAWWLGQTEAKRLGWTAGTAAWRYGSAASGPRKARAAPAGDESWVNSARHVLLMTAMIAAKLEPVVVFMVGARVGDPDQLSEPGDRSESGSMRMREKLS